MKTFPHALLAALSLSALVAATAMHAGEEKPAPQETPKAAPDKAEALSAAMALIAKMEAMEKRIQSLEQAMVEKDARIADLQKKLAEVPPVPQAAPPQPDGLGGFQMNLTPEQMRELNKRLEDFFKNNLDEPPGGGGGQDDPWGHRGQRQMDEELDQMMREFGADRRRDAGPRAPAQKPRLGVRLAEVSAQLNTLHRNKAEEGAFVAEVVPDSPADKAGLGVGDCVTSFNGKPVRSVQALVDMIAVAPEGKSKLGIMRKGEDMTVEVNIGKPIAMPEAAPNPPAREDRGWMRKEEDAPRKEITEVRSGSLELPDSLAKEMKLDEKARKRLQTAMSEHAKRLAEDYLAKTEQRRQEGRRALGDDDLQAMAESHALEIEKELKGLLSEQQLESWRKYRAKNGHAISIFRRIQEERAGDGENMNF
ncbi:MAG: PDZ domain-containing protein [Planctomycetes bacterium]|nr:PDZ domain-containing protein [Planctomycetota bacterium]